jgi:hypothetical protein
MSNSQLGNCVFWISTVSRQFQKSDSFPGSLNGTLVLRGQTGIVEGGHGPADGLHLIALRIFIARQGRIAQVALGNLVRFQASKRGLIFDHVGSKPDARIRFEVLGFALGAASLDCLVRRKEANPLMGFLA